LQGDDFSSDTTIDLPQTGGKGHKNLAHGVPAGISPSSAKEERQQGNAGAA
jgi:hypothetical protein